MVVVPYRNIVSLEIPFWSSFQTPPHGKEKGRRYPTNLIALAYLLFFMTTVTFSVIYTLLVRNVAIRRNWVSNHSNSRSIHDRPIPRLGGVAIFLAFNTGLILLLIAYDQMGRNPETFKRILLQIMPAATLIFTLGLLDDIFDLKAWLKFIVQVGAALLLYYNGLQIHDLSFLSGLGIHNLGTAISMGLTVLWVVGITNAFNLIDGLDGLAAGSAFFATSAVFVVALLTGFTPIALITVGLIAAITGFLRFNFHPASIFLGDSGSLFLGFMLSALALVGVQKSPTLVAVALPVVACGLPILDTAIAIVRRMLGGKPIFSSDREHIHHKLMDRGLSQRQVVIMLYGVSALCAFLSLFLLRPGGGALAIVVAVMGVGAWMGLQQLDYRELSELKRLARRTVDQKKIIANNIAVHQANEELGAADSEAAIKAIFLRVFENNAFDEFDLRSTDGELTYRWSRDEQLSARPAGWSMSIPLVTKSGERVGDLKLYRAYSDLPLLVDINLFTSGFPMKAGEALERARLALTHLATSSPRQRYER
jgi:UDP-GlcNAc:undecaprenyl-phosphate/decaprenyl-phosphate GlcNAc-1-phosphate transferase